MITLIGLGPGAPGAMTRDALDALTAAELVIGAPRLLAALPESAAERVPEYRPEAILRLLREDPGRRACAIYSGDTGFYSGASGLISLLEREGLAYRVLPGLSSVQVLAARLGLDWQGWRLCSAHGRSCDIAREVLRGRDVFFLTGGDTGPAALCRALTDAGLGRCPAAVGERLSYPDERVTCAAAAEIAAGDFAPLSVLLIRQPPPEPAAPDSARRRLMVAAMGSGSGKTVLCCGLLAALTRRGLACEAFKCGPDYIDPMFHSRVLGLPSRSLDPFLQGEAALRRTLNGQRRPFALIEAAMGYYDGVAGGTEASAWAVARAENIPVLLALRPGGASLSLAAQVRGMLDFRSPSRIVGLVLTDCREALYARLRPLLERETGLPVLGFVPPMPEAEIESRHLGLLTAAEVKDFQARFAAVAERLEETLDLDRLLTLAAPAPEAPLPPPEKAPPACTLAVARDEAFCFYYQDSLDALERAGAKLRFFSPLRDAALPPCDGLYLGGGYPELHAAALSENRLMRESIRAAVLSGLPTVAECGGFLYLQQSLEDPSGAAWPMAGALPGAGLRGESLKRFGYAFLRPEEDSLLFRAGERVPVHEFHYWDSTACGEALPVEKPDGRRWRCGCATPTLYAAFPHLHFAGALPLAERFVAAARERGSL